MAMGEISEQSLIGQNLIGQVGDALAEIIGSIEQVNTVTNHIAVATMQQSSGAEEISRSIENVSTVSKNSTQLSQKVAYLSGQLNEEVQALHSLMDQFKV